MKRRRLLPLAAMAAAGALALAGCAGGGGASAGSQGTELEGLTGQIGAKDFSEQFILAYITAGLLNAYGADVEANTKLVGSANVRQALENDEFLGYWEYTGTSWITYNGNTTPVQGADAQFQATKEADAANGIAWLDPAPLNNTYAFAIRKDKADELGVTTLSDVAALPAADQTFCIESEFSTRDDGWPGLKAAYGITVPDANVALLDTGVIYTATQKGDDCNFGEVFQTDGRIPALDLVVMKCLKKRINDRPKSAEDLETMLAAIPLEGLPKAYERRAKRAVPLHEDSGTIPALSSEPPPPKA